MKRLTFLAAVLVAAIGSAHAGEQWDMPMAYADSNYHTQNGKLFAEAVGICTGGELTIVVHGGGSLFKGNEIKRAVQTGQVPIGESCSALMRTRMLCSLRFRAVSGLILRGFGPTLARSKKNDRHDPRRSKSCPPLFGALATPGHVLQETDHRCGRHGRNQVPFL